MVIAIQLTSFLQLTGISFDVGNDDYRGSEMPTATEGQYIQLQLRIIITIFYMIDQPISCMSTIGTNNIQHEASYKYQCLINPLINSKEANSPVQQCLISDHYNYKEITWKHFLDKVDSVFPGVLLCTHVCKARMDHN